jgi:hypothetical protein
MKIGIIGPNKIYDFDTDERKVLLDKVAKIIVKSGNEIILTPDKNSLLEYFGNKYTELNGKKVWLVIPKEEANYKDYLNTKIGEVVYCDNWDNQADEFNRQSDIFVCVGYAWGAMKEIAAAQYFNKKKIYILKEFVSTKLPSELNFLVEYISIDDLRDIF